MNNQFQDFSNRMIAKHKGFGQAFDGASMIFPEMEPVGETGGTSIENHYIRNLYQIQNLTEENHLYRQNLQFITNILEKKLEQRVVPSVEKLVEKAIQEEMPGVEKQVIHEMTEQLHTLVKEGGIEQLSVLREQLQREVETRTKEVQRETEVRTTETRRELEREVRSLEMKRELIREVRAAENNRVQKLKETTNLTKQEVLLRKIENIYNSSTQNHFYGNTGQMGVQTVTRMAEHTVAQPGVQIAAQPEVYTSVQSGEPVSVRPGVQMPQRTFNSLHLEYEAQVPEEVTGNIQSQEVPEMPEFLKTQERALEQQRETIARQLKEITKLQTQDRQTVTQLQNRMQQSERTEQIETVHTREPETVPEIVPESQIQNATEFQNTELQPHMELPEQNILGERVPVPEHRSKSIFRVEDLKRRRQPEEAFQEAELLYSFERTSDEHWNEIRQEIVKELQSERNQTISTPVPMARQLAEQIFRQAGETIRQKTGGTVTIHPAALEYLEQALDTESEYISGAAQGQRKQVQQEVQQPENSTVLQTVERILDAYRVQREPVKAAARSVEPKTGIVQQILGEPGNARMQPQSVSQPGAVMIQQMPGKPGVMMLQQMPGIPAKTAMEQASMIYPEEVSPQERTEQSQKLQKQIHEITQDIKEVKKSTVVHQEILTEQQKEVVREVIRQVPETVKEKDVSTLIRRQVQREVETQVDASLGQMTNRVYRRIEEKLRTERGRRGLL